MRTKCSPFWAETNHKKDFLRKEKCTDFIRVEEFYVGFVIFNKDPPSLLKDQQADVIAKPCRFLYAFKITLQWLYISLLSTISGVIFIFVFILLLSLLFLWNASEVCFCKYNSGLFFLFFFKKYNEHSLTERGRCQQLLFFIFYFYFFLLLAHL